MKSSAARVKKLYSGTLPPAYDDRASIPRRSTQRPSAGCNIKWKAGNEPAYYG